METLTETKLSKNIQSACNAIHKEIDRKANQIIKLEVKARQADKEADELREEIKGLEEQISKLKGE